MDDDHRELANWLFATATAMLEGAASTAATGQSSRQNASQLIDLGRGLQAAVCDIAVIAETATNVAARANKKGRKGR